MFNDNRYKKKHNFAATKIITMINRALIRTKIVQLMYAWQSNPQIDATIAKKQLQTSLNKTYEVYFWLLLLTIDITEYATNRIEIGLNKLRPTAEEQNPNKRFINNKFYKQLSVNKELADYVHATGLRWDRDSDFIKSMYEAVIASDEYKEYMAAEHNTYDDDKMVWRKIYKKVLAESDLLYDQLEEMDIYWNDDIEIVLSFIDKTIKHFSQDNNENQELLPMFHDDTDREYAYALLDYAVMGKDEYTKMIAENAKNWDEDRMAAMDVCTMIVAIAELINFPLIPVNVTINEYMEISKLYSTSKSYEFLNGILDTIASKLKKEGKLVKVAIVKKQINK